MENVGRVNFLEFFCLNGYTGGLKKSENMAILATSAGVLIQSAYQRLTPTNFLSLQEPSQISKRKKEAAENLVLAIIKAAVAIPLYAALYVADMHLKRTELKVLATLCAFCLHPSATIDYLFFRGLQVMKQGIPYSQVFHRLEDQAFAQAKNEGYHLPYRKLYLDPKESRERVGKIFVDLIAEHKTSIDAGLAKANQFYLRGGVRFLLGLIGGSWVSHYCDNKRVWADEPFVKPHPLFWLDRHMVSLSKRIASRWV
jgi:hypothetical protein